MKILIEGKYQGPRTLTGTCHQCGCVVEVAFDESKELVDKDTKDGSCTRYVDCPTKGCDCQYLWVN